MAAAEMLVTVSLRLPLACVNSSLCSCELKRVHHVCQGAIGFVDRSLVAISPGDRQDFTQVQSLIDLRSEPRPGTSCRLTICPPEERLLLRRGTPGQQEKRPIRQGIAPRTPVGIEHPYDARPILGALDQQVEQPQIPVQQPWARDLVKEAGMVADELACTSRPN